MEEIIKITEKEGIKVISARELHAYLEIDTRFDTWVSRMIDYGFIINVDCSKSSIENQMVDWALTLECAKHWAMMQRTVKGMQARRYFIECEKQLLKPRELSRKEMAMMVIEAETAKELAEAKLKELGPKVEVYEKISNADNLLTLNDAAKAIGIGRNTMTKRLRELGVLYNLNPYQKYIDSKYFEVKIRVIKKEDTIQNYPQTFVTGRGLTWLTKKLT